jgi:hypothetical protein
MQSAADLRWHVRLISERAKCTEQGGTATADAMIGKRAGKDREIINTGVRRSIKPGAHRHRASRSRYLQTLTGCRRPLLIELS